MRGGGAAWLLGAAVVLAAAVSRTAAVPVLPPRAWWRALPRSARSPAGMPTQLEAAMGTMIRVFHRYSCKEGDRFKLNKGELKMLLQQELTEFLTCQKDPELVDKIMQDLDADKDNEVDFREFVVMVAALTVACNDYFVEQLKKKGNETVAQSEGRNMS
ncbi:protein S100-Z-like isoform X2 [Tamandua tetradactyla]|uniref:protein S100-Z-like isoform X2 n=1 Tax=Tamandua tetradactyla TaxID=48850 RepID=UPI00405386CB